MRVFRDAKEHTRRASFAAIAGVGRVVHIIKTFGIAPPHSHRGDPRDGSGRACRAPRGSVRPPC